MKKGAFYNEDKYYRPTYNSTMRQTRSHNIQFGPVNTYHLTASLKIRLGLFGSDIPDLACDDDGYFYEWSHYSIDDFKDEWSPEKFK